MDAAGNGAGFHFYESKMMSNKKKSRDDRRDSKGRWKKGTSGNPNGRPRSVPDLDMADVHNFSVHPMEITIGGETQTMTRHEIVLLKTFEAGLKGRITALKYLLEKFEGSEMERATLRLSIAKWLERYADDPSSVPMQVFRILERAENALNPRQSTLRTKNGKKRKRK